MWKTFYFTNETDDNEKGLYMKQTCGLKRRRDVPNSVNGFAIKNGCYQVRMGYRSFGGIFTDYETARGYGGDNMYVNFDSIEICASVTLAAGLAAAVLTILTF